MSKSDLESEYTAACSRHKVEIDHEMLRRIRATTPEEVAKQIISVSSPKPSLAQDIAEAKGDVDDE